MTHTTTEIAAMIERLEAWEPLVSSGYEVPAAGRSMLEAAAMLREVARERDARTIGEEVAFNQRNMALDALKAAEAEAAALGEALMGYRAAVRYIGADAWDGCSDCIEILKLADQADWDRAPLTDDEVARTLARLRRSNALKETSDGL